MKGIGKVGPAGVTPAQEPDKGAHFRHFYPTCAEAAGRPVGQGRETRGIPNERTSVYS